MSKKVTVRRSNAVLTRTFPPTAAAATAATPLSCFFPMFRRFRRFRFPLSCFHFSWFVVRFVVRLLFRFFVVSFLSFFSLCLLVFCPLVKSSASICWPFGLPPLLECPTSRRWMTTSWHNESLPATTVKGCHDWKVIR